MGVQIGDVIDGKYKIVALLGEGGMGSVYEGMNTRIHRRVAIKVLHAGVANNAEALMRFEREAQAAGRIGSEHIVEVLDLGDLPGGERYMVMEFLEGESLRDRMARGPLSPRAIATLTIGMLEGLRAAHAAGIVHRDFKPDNVFLLTTRSGTPDFVKIVDFGISKFSSLGGEFSMTRTGAVMGTPYYMAPEQARGGAGIDHRVDLYAIGVILYQAVVGKVPFDAETFNELLFKIVLESPPPLTERVPSIDPHFAALVEKAMARDAAARFQTAEEFQSAMRAWLGGTYVAAGQTLTGGTPARESAEQRPGAEMHTVPRGVASPGTHGAWVHTGTSGDRPIKERSKRAIWIAAGLALAGLVGAAILTTGREESTQVQPTAEQSTVPQNDVVRAEEERRNALSALEDERSRAEQARRQAEDAKLDAERDKAALEAEKQAQEAKRDVHKQSARPAPIRPPPRPSGPRPAAAPAPAPTPSSAGRPIRTDL